MGEVVSCRQRRNQFDLFGGRHLAAIGLNWARAPGTVPNPRDRHCQTKPA